ncbi:MAG: hypothetical protein R6X02_19085 [Enhygromyxa sp.]
MKILRIATLLFSTTLLFTACKKDGGIEAKDWTTVALTEQSVTLGGVSVSWKVPEGLTKDEDLSSDTSISLKSGEMGDPSVSLKVGGIPPTSLDRAVNSAGFLFGQGGETLEQTERDGRFVVVLANDKKNKLLVAHYIKAGETALECVISQMTNDGVPDFEASVARFHEICDSVAVE